MEISRYQAENLLVHAERPSTCPCKLSMFKELWLKWISGARWKSHPRFLWKTPASPEESEDQQNGKGTSGQARASVSVLAPSFSSAPFSMSVPLAGNSRLKTTVKEIGQAMQAHSAGVPELIFPCEVFGSHPTVGFKIPVLGFTSRSSTLVASHGGLILIHF